MNNVERIFVGKNTTIRISWGCHNFVTIMQYENSTSNIGEYFPFVPRGSRANFASKVNE